MNTVRQLILLILLAANLACSSFYNGSTLTPPKASELILPPTVGSGRNGIAQFFESDLFNPENPNATLQLQMTAKKDLITFLKSKHDIEFFPYKQFLRLSSFHHEKLTELRINRFYWHRFWENDQKFLSGIFLYSVTENIRISRKEYHTLRLCLLGQLAQINLFDKNFALNILPLLNTPLELALIADVNRTCKLGIEQSLIKHITDHLDKHATPHSFAPGLFYLFQFLSTHYDQTHLWLKTRFLDESIDACVWSFQTIAAHEPQVALNMYRNLRKEIGAAGREHPSGNAAYLYFLTMEFSHVGEFNDVDLKFISTMKSALKDFKDDSGDDAVPLNYKIVFDTFLAPLVFPLIPNREPSILPTRVLKKRIELLRQLQEHYKSQAIDNELEAIIHILEVHLKKNSADRAQK